jgi:ubiquitin carboxyl-terminal hydrolase 4/11/15
VADEAWFNFLKRNQSIIVDLMYGQYKSVLDCPKCNNISVQFDPFLMVSLPIRDAKKKTI